MGRVVIDERGVIEEEAGSGVTVLLSQVGVVRGDNIMLCRSEPLSVPEGQVAIWRDGYDIVGKRADGKPLKLVTVEAKKVIAAPVKKVGATRKSSPVRKPPAMPKPPKKAAKGFPKKPSGE